ncbi:MAG: ATP-binding protein [Acidobacteriota bacterium]|nr:ATP-binding protein [Acidobacteriota bacterium]
MTWFAAQPLSRKLVVIVMAVTASALLMSSAGFLLWDTLRFRNETLRDLETQASIVADSTAVSLIFLDPGEIGSTLASLQARNSIDNAAIYNVSGRRAAEYVRPGSLRRIPDQAMGWDGSLTLARAEILRPVTTRDGKVVGYVFLATELDEMWARFRAQLLGLSTMFLIATGGALLLSARLQQTISRPLGDLARTASSISNNSDYSLRATQLYPDELGTLVATFNTMLDRIEAREQELEDANVTLQEASRLKDDFLATLSHELRTPLNAMLGWSRLLRTDRVAPEAQERALAAIERNATIQARLIDDLLDISRVIRGKFRLEVEPLDLAVVAEAAIEIIRPGATAKSITVDIDAPAGSGLITGDAQRLQQVLWNLLSNAVKFTPPGGRISVRLSTDGADELVAVSDTGAGIDPSFLPHVFDLFRQADASATREYGGLGLGLAIVRKVVELHGGTVAASSAGPGTGTTIVVRLPRRANPSSPSSASSMSFTPAPARPAGEQTISGLRVLVVEDDDDSRELVQTLLETRGAVVTAVASAAEAIGTLRHERPDIIVSDIAMRGEDGYALIRRVRAMPRPLGGVPAVALTAYAGEPERERALALGFQGFVAKPFDAALLVATILELARPAQPRGL